MKGYFVTLIIFLIIPIIELIVGLAKPKKEINGLVGYRTARTRSSQEMWDFGQLLMKKYNLRLGIVSAIAGLVGFAICVLNPDISGIMISVIYVLQMISLIVVTLMMDRVMAKKMEEGND